MSEGAKKAGGEKEENSDFLLAFSLSRGRYDFQVIELTNMESEMKMG